MEETKESRKLDLIREALFEGYYDELGNFHVTYIKQKLEEVLCEVLGVDEVEIY